MSTVDLHSTWKARVQIQNEKDLLARLRSAGLPLAEPSGEGEEGDSDNSKLCAVVSVIDGVLAAVVASPSGLVFRFEPDHVDPQWWAFAAKNYYIVTGNAQDRKLLADLGGADIKAIKGRTVSRKKDSEPSRMSLDQLLETLCPAERQGGLF
ncbi:hypothetical protein ABIC83_002441 [Roseateles asaccharophilus]|uniref:hypothetical protein n=1 Tax=Roseateles asaccharophilus TaxID=582607 RepID=UPI003835C31C